jgi:hypothetical protein
MQFLLLIDFFNNAFFFFLVHITLNGRVNVNYEVTRICKGALVACFRLEILCKAMKNDDEPQGMQPPYPESNAWPQEYRQKYVWF